VSKKIGAGHGEPFTVYRRSGKYTILPVGFGHGLPEVFYVLSMLGISSTAIIWIILSSSILSFGKIHFDEESDLTKMLLKLPKAVWIVTGIPGIFGLVILGLIIIYDVISH
jgi:hypothetical protein